MKRAPKKGGKKATRAAWKPFFLPPMALPAAVPWLTGIAGILFLVAQHKASFMWGWTDENVHAYVAKQITEGATLYGEIHSARPPLVLAFPALLMALGLEPLLAMRIAVVVPSILTGLGIAYFARKWWGDLTSVLTLVLYFGAAELAARIAFTGIQSVALFATFCVLLTADNRAVWAGVAAGLGLATGQHAAVMIGLSGVLNTIRNPKDGVRFATVATAIAAVIYGIAYAAGGTDMWADLVGKHGYHFVGKHVAEDNGEDFAWFMKTVRYAHAGYFQFILQGIFVTVWQSLAKRASWKERYINPTFVIVLAVAAHVATVFVMKGGLILYQHVPFALFAMLSGLGLARSIEYMRAGVGWFGVGVVILQFGAVTFLGWTAATSLYNERDHQTYSWEPHVRHHQMMRLQDFVTADVIANDIRALSSERDTLFGDGTLVSLVALKSGRRVAGQYADIAPRWYANGTLSREKVVRAIEADNVRYIVTSRLYYTKDPYFVRYFRRCYDSDIKLYPRLAPGTPGAGLPPFLLLKHKPESCEVEPDSEVE